MIIGRFLSFSTSFFLLYFAFRTPWFFYFLFSRGSNLVGVSFAFFLVSKIYIPISIYFSFCLE